MNKFKKILLQIATLSLADQKWILNQLPEQQQEQFSQLQGTTLLNQAQRFRHIDCTEINQETTEYQLPALCHNLAQQDPLFIAIILEQGQFPWENQWLETHIQGEKIKGLNHLVQSIKPATRLCAFRQWQTQLDFTDHLAVPHG